MNSYQTTGRLTQDPVYRDLPGTDDKHVTELRLAVNGMGSGSRDAVGYIDVVSYPMTKKAADTIGKGWLVGITGRIEHQTWETDGQKRSKHRVVATRVEFLAAPRNSETDASEVEVPSVDEIPF